MELRRSPTHGLAPVGLAACALLGAFSGWRIASHGGNLGSYLGVLAYVLFVMVLPGWAVWRRLWPWREDRLFELGMGWAFGFALHAIGFLGVGLVGLPIWSLVTLALLPLAVPPWRQVHRPSSDLERVRPGHVVALVALLFVLLQRVFLYGEGAFSTGFTTDLLFHAGNAAEMLREGAPVNPRILGEPLNYHFLAYGMSAGASVVTGVPVHQVLMLYGAMVLPGFMALQVFNAGRCFGLRAAAGLGALLAVSLHKDVLAEVSRLLDWGFGEQPLGPVLELAMHSSPPSQAGLAMLATLAILILRWFQGPLGSSRNLVLLVALISFATAGTKGSIMPAVGLASVGLCLWCLARRRGSLGRALGLTACLGLGSLPLTLFLAVGEGSFAGSMFRLDPLSVLRRSEFGLWAGEKGLGAPWLVPLWLPLVLGLGTVAGWGLVRRLRSEPREGDVFSAALVAVSLALPAFLAAGGSSELYFLYNAQFGLAWGGGAFLFDSLARRGSGGWSLLAWGLSLPLLLGLARDIHREASRDLAPPRPDALALEYEKGLRWLRQETPSHSVLLARHTSLFLSAFAERRTFYEGHHFTPAFYRRLWEKTPEGWTRNPRPGHAFPQHAGLQGRFWKTFDVGLIESMLSLGESSGAWFVVEDQVRLQPRSERSFEAEWKIGRVGPRLERSPALELVFENEVLRIYRLSWARSSGPR